jgi:hypothetical protein
MNDCCLAFHHQQGFIFIFFRLGILASGVAGIAEWVALAASVGYDYFRLM